MKPATAASKWFRLSDVVAEIASIAYPNEPQVGARKRVRERIRYARSKNLIKVSYRGGDEIVEAVPFFQWAVGKWPVLARAPGVPVTVHGVAQQYVGNVDMRASGLVIPKDPAELRRLYESTVSERDALSRELEACRQRLAEAEPELAERRRREAETRAKRSAAGKRGGRGRSL